MSRLKVYISSTFRDLQDYRSMVIREFESTFSEDFELSRVMERMYDNGHSVPFVQDCEQQVRESDVYLLILGNRVGSRPPGSNRSYTEHEYDTALQSRKRIFRFVIRNFDRSQCDDPAEYSGFRERMAGLPVHEFTDLPSFENKLLRCLSYLMQSGGRGQRTFYTTLAVIVSLTGLVAAGIATYFLREMPRMVVAGFAALILLTFSGIVLYVLRYILFPSSMSTLKKTS